MSKPIGEGVCYIVSSFFDDQPDRVVIAVLLLFGNARPFEASSGSPIHDKVFDQARARKRTMHVTMDHAKAAIDAARAEAVTLGTQMCIAIVDSGANLKAFVRMDDAWVGSIDIAVKKARTAVFFGMPTGAIGQLSQPGGSLFGIERSNDGLITFPGGLPIVDEHGVLVGAIGVSGSSVENDEAVAKAGVAILGSAELPAHPWRT